MTEAPASGWYKWAHVEARGCSSGSYVMSCAGVNCRYCCLFIPDFILKRPPSCASRIGSYVFANFLHLDVASLTSAATMIGQ